MPTGRLCAYTDIVQQLVKKGNELDATIKISQENKLKYEVYSEQIEAFENRGQEYKSAANKLSKLISDIEEYLGEKSKRGNQAINTALMSARNVVPDAMEGIHMAVEGKEMWLETEDGMLIERMEGGGFRASCSFFCRKVALASNPSTMQLLILDELLSKLSAESSVTLSQYLPLLTKDMQLIIIEQKREVLPLNCIRYNFFLAEGKTIVEREVLE